MIGFGKAIKQVFGNIDSLRTVERVLQNLRQTSSVSEYTAKFQQYTTKIDQNDRALKAQFYKGLKDTVKDEIACSDKPDDLDELITLLVKIDNYNYE